MASGSELIVRITGKDVGLKQVLNEAGDDVGKFGSRLDGLGGKIAGFGKVAALGLAGAAVGVGAFLKSSVEAAEESRKVMAQTNAVIASTGGVAGVTAAGVDKLSSSLSAMSGIDDEVITGGQNMLLTFTNVRNAVGKGNDIFDQGTKAALNMSVALGTDMSSASMLVGKALNDPIKGMAALTKSGIQFTTQQKDQVKAMVAAGDTLGAQKIILKELETQFGGSAEAAASPMARLKVVVGNLQEEIGARLLPVLGTAATFLADKLPGALDKVIGLFSGLFSLFAKGDFTGTLGKALGIEEDSPIVDKALKFQDRIMGMVDTVVAFFKANWPQIRDTVSEVLETVGAIISGFVDVATTIWNNFGSQIVSYAREAFDAIMQVVGGAMDVIQGIIKTVTSIIHGDWSGAWEGIKQILSGAWSIIHGLVDQAMNIMQTAISIGMEILGSIISSAWEGIVNFIASIPGRILDALGDLGSLLFSAGQDLIWGMLNGIKSMAGRLAEAAKDVARGAVNAVKGFLGIGSPSKLFMGFGINIGQGLANGITGSERLVSSAATSLAGSSVGGYGGPFAGSTGSTGLGVSSGSSAAGADGRNITINITVTGGQVEPMHLAREIAWAMG